ncbi:Hypothetical protein FKW44_016109 [Caligus rogercresseyi]|uniref:Uncharacterized protein n=1 Tax=Caligus rogercresseyi TaxID=217165 RepID=A0A7T8K1R4_CALRO|nr:Hypothetical protein FKW44_016109 [Caligus rogercresseyi]
MLMRRRRPPSEEGFSITDFSDHLCWTKFPFSLSPGDLPGYNRSLMHSRSLQYSDSHRSGSPRHSRDPYSSSYVRALTPRLIATRVLSEGSRS